MKKPATEILDTKVVQKAIDDAYNLALEHVIKIVYQHSGGINDYDRNNLINSIVTKVLNLKSP